MYIQTPCSWFIQINTIYFVAKLYISQTFKTYLQLNIINFTEYLHRVKLVQEYAAKLEFKRDEFWKNYGVILILSLPYKMSRRKITWKF